MKRVLVLGGTQFFGKRLVELLLSKGHSVTIATRGITTDSFGEQVERLIIDREDKGSMLSAFEGQNWDIVYDQSCFSPIEARDTTEALKGKASRYIFTSSMAVYNFGTRLKEDDFKPEDFHFEYKKRREYPGYAGYQEAKRASEAVLFNQKELEVVAVRFPIVIGEDDYTNRLKFHVDRVVGGKAIGIKLPKARYSFITSQEAAEFLLEIGFHQYTGQINPGCKGDMSLYELIGKIEKETGCTALVESNPAIEDISPYAMEGSWSINTDKANELGFHFAPLQDTVERLIRYYLEEKVNTF